MTALTVEMYVLVVVLMMAIVTMAQFVAHTVATVFQNMHQVVLAEERERTEDARLVDRQNLILQFR